MLLSQSQDLSVAIKTAQSLHFTYRRTNAWIEGETGPRSYSKLPSGIKTTLYKLLSSVDTYCKLKLPQFMSKG